MNAKGLEKLYDRLTPRERLPLIVAASARDDVLELRRLTDSAPTITFRVNDYFGLGKVMTQVADLHVLTLLDLAANFWQWWGLWLAWPGTGEAGQRKGKARVKADEARQRQLGLMVRYHAYRFQVHVDAWKLFCSELTIDHDALLNFLPGWDTITRTEVRARELAFTRKDAAMFLLSEAVGPDGEEGGDAPQVETVEGLAKAWHALVEQEEKWWKGGGKP
jgi:hypothetical protein